MTATVPEVSVPPDTARDAEVESLRADIVRLRADVEIANGQAQAARNALADARAQHDRDVRVIGEAVKDTSNRHEWCGEYDRHVRDLLDSGRLSPIGYEAFQESATREQDYRVTVRLVIETSVSVTAQSSDAAAEIVGDDVSSYVDRYDLSWDNVTDTEVTDVEEDY